MYLIFWFADKAPKSFKEFSAYGISKSGDEFIQLSFVERISKDYIDFDEILLEFFEQCKKNIEVIKELRDKINGTFHIEIVPEMSKLVSTPAIILDRKVINLINFLGEKFEYLEIDSYNI